MLGAPPGIMMESAVFDKFRYESFHQKETVSINREQEDEKIRSDFRETWIWNTVQVG
jgi:hypothetical protein